MSPIECNVIRSSLCSFQIQWPTICLASTWSIITEVPYSFRANKFSGEIHYDNYAAVRLFVCSFVRSSTHTYDVKRLIMEATGINERYVKKILMSLKNFDY